MSEATQRDIKPCPFCGSAAKYEFADPGAPYPGGYPMMSCTNKDCLSDAFHSEPKCLTEDEPEGRRKAIEKWNTRALTTATAPLEQRLVDDAETFATIAGERDFLKQHAADLERQLAEAKAGEDRGYTNICLIAKILGLEVWSVEEVVAEVKQACIDRDQLREQLAETLNARDRALSDKDAVSANYDRLKEQLAEAKRERDAFLAVLEGFQYEKIDKLAGEPLDVARRVGEMALERVADTITERDQLRAYLAAVTHLLDERAVPIGMDSEKYTILQRVEWLADVKAKWVIKSEKVEADLAAARKELKEAKMLLLEEGRKQQSIIESPDLFLGWKGADSDRPFRSESIALELGYRVTGRFVNVERLNAALTPTH